MYYNIKIKSNGSEFSLETNHKEVLEREMDLYFACIFNVSDDFKSKIKKVEIISENVKSIEEFEAPKPTKQQHHKLSEERIQELAKLKAEEIIKAQQAKLQKEKNELIFTDSFDEKQIFSPNPKKIINENIIQFNNQPTETIKFQNVPILDEIKQEQINNITDTQTLKQKPQEELPNEIMELIHLAQKKIETIEKTPTSNLTKEESTILNLDNKPEAKNIPESQSKQDKQKSIEDIFNTPTPNKFSEDEIQELSIQTPETKEGAIFNDAIEVSLTDIEVTLQPEEVETEQKKLIHTKEDSSNQNDKIATSQTDFKSFLQSYECEELIDEFLACAYFIKNLLNYNDFSMKFINSKLFQTTGKIADMSIVDELTTKEYIRNIETEDGKKYSITLDGEEYFITKFQK